MNFYAKLLAAFIVLFAATNIASADSFTVDDARRGYFIPDGGTLSGKKLMVLDGEFGLLCKADQGYGVNINGKASTAKTNVQVYKFSNTDAACYFRFIPLTGADLGYYNIKASYCDMYLDVLMNNGTSPDNGDNVELYSVGTSDETKWKLIKNSDGTYTIQNKKNPNMVLDMKGGGAPENGKDIQVYTSNNSDAQRWYLQPVSGAFVNDPYFKTYLCNKGFAKLYNTSSKTVERDAKLSDFYTAGKKVVIDCEAVTELNALGEWGDITNSGDTNHPKKFTGVTNLIGIEYFYKLKKLDMSRHIPGDDFNSYGSYYPRLKPENINLQYNTELEWLDLNYANFNTISEVNNSHINGLTELRYLNFCNNFFKEFDMRPYKKLQRMQMAHNFDLTKIYTEPNDSLLELAIFDSMYGWENGYSLQSLIDNFKNLVFLHAFATPNEEIDLSEHTDLQSIWLLKSAYGADKNLVYDGTYNIVCHYDRDLLFDCEGGASGQGTDVQLWNTRPDEKWHQFNISHVTTDNNNVRWYKIIAAHTSNMCVEAAGSSPGNNSNVQLWPYDGADNKLWRFRRNSDGTYHIINKKNPSVAIDVKDVIFKAGTSLQVYATNDNQEAQKFVLIPVALKITNGQAGSARQISKGPWLHKLDLSNNTKLRDIHVQNMHLASLNINSEYIGTDLEAPYNTWQVCREVSNLPSSLDGKSNVSPHEVVVDNNYRHVNANYYKRYDDETKKWYTMFYIRTDIDNNCPELEAGLLVDNQTSFFETMTFDNYVDDATKGDMSRKTFNISRTLAEECFNGKRVLGAKKAVETDNINSIGLMDHAVGTDQLCMIKNYGKSIEIINNPNSGVSQEFLDHVPMGVKGTIIILKAYITDSEPETTPTDVPRAICYDYDMNSNSTTSAYNTSAQKAAVVIDTNNPNAPIIGTFFFDVHYPNIPLNEVVTGIEDIKVENKEVAAVKYYNVAGVESNYPFMGINIAVITYTDGTRSSVKIVK